MKLAKLHALKRYTEINLYGTAKACVRREADAEDRMGADDWQDVDGGSRLWDIVSDLLGDPDLSAKILLDKALQWDSEAGYTDEELAEEMEMSVDDFRARRKKIETILHDAAGGIADMIRTAVAEHPKSERDYEAEQITEAISSADYQLKNLDKAERRAVLEIDTAIELRTILDRFVDKYPAKSKTDREEAGDRVREMAFDD